MRLFVAVPLPAECRTMLEEQQRRLQRHKADVRWVAPRSIHLTLKFLGEVDEGVIPALIESLEKASETAHPFQLQIRGLGCFPNPKNPRVVWSGIEGESHWLAELQRKVEAACTKMGFEPEGRGFRPHLTLGRVNGKRNLQLLLDCIKIGSELECSFTADHFSLYKSTLKPQGAEYSVLKTVMLH